MPSKRPSNAESVRPQTLTRVQEAAVLLLALGTLGLVSAADGLSWWTLGFCLSAILVRAIGWRLPTNWGFAALLALAGAAPVYWFLGRNWGAWGIKDFLLGILMVFLLSAQSGRDFAAVSSYCLWILLASLFPHSGPQQWLLVGLIFGWFLLVQSLNELRRSRELSPEWKGREGWRLLRSALGLALLVVLGIGGISVGLYFLIPRNPLRAYSFQFQPLRRLVGFSNSVRIGEIGELQKERTPAFRVRFLNGKPPAVLRWRGAALADFNGQVWMNRLETWNEFPHTARISVASDEQRRLPGTRIFYEINSLATMDRVILSAGVAEYVFLPEGRLRMNGEGGLRQLAAEATLPSYSLAAWMGADGELTAHPAASDVSLRMSPERRQRYLRLPAMDPRIRELALTLTRSWTGAMSQAEAVENHLRRNFRYSLSTKVQSREPLRDFLFQTKAGHCEYFASAMAVLLRQAGVPTRVVTGFYGRLPEPVGQWYVIRSGEAHSWVEVWVEGRGWVVFDPTPPGSEREGETEWAKWFRGMEDRMLVLSEEWMGGAGGWRRPQWPEWQIDWTRWGGAGLSLLLLVGLIWFLWRWKGKTTGRPQEATLLFERFLAEAGIARKENQTAREVAGAHAALRLAYERARFGGDAESLRQLRELVSASKSEGQGEG